MEDEIILLSRLRIRRLFIKLRCTNKYARTCCRDSFVRSIYSASKPRESHLKQNRAVQIHSLSQY